MWSTTVLSVLTFTLLHGCRDSHAVTTCICFALHGLGRDVIINLTRLFSCVKLFALNLELIELCVNLIYSYSCGKSVHVRCMKMWAEHQSSSGASFVRCPLCREDFGPIEVNTLGHLILGENFYSR